jgi:two-component system, LuxR family, sensor kinase FixL
MGRLSLSERLLSNSPLTSGTDLSALLHELNQPLTAILSNAQAAQRFLSHTVLDRAELREILEDIVADDKRAVAIIKQLSQALKEAHAAAATAGPSADCKTGVRR